MQLRAIPLQPTCSFIFPPHDLHFIFIFTIYPKTDLKWKSKLKIQGISFLRGASGKCGCVIIFIMTSPGEEKAWEMMASLDHSVIRKNASVLFDEKRGCYMLRSLCTDVYIHPQERTIRSSTPDGEILINKYGYFFVHSCLWYLIHAKDIPLTGRLVKPVNLKGGEIFFRGSHALPLEGVAKKYGHDKEAFIKKGKELCAEFLEYGDASLRLFPLPRIPVTLILWLGDEEFPPGTDLLFDSSCEIHLPLDILWSIAMTTLLVMM